MSRIVGAGLGVLALGPARAAAQNEAEPSGPLSTWRFQVDVGGTWYENPTFRVAGQESSWSTTAQGSLGLNKRFRTGSFSLSGYGGWLSYPEIQELDQATYGGAAGLSWAPSPRTQLSLSQNYARSNTRQLPSLDLEGLPVPTTGVDTATSSLDFSQGLSRRTSLQMDGTFVWRRYDTSTLVGGEQVQVGVGLAHQLSEYSSISLLYGFTNSWIESQPSRVHIAGLGVQRQPERGLGLEIGGGVAYLEYVGQYHPTGRAGLSATGRRTSAQVLYRRDFGQAFGYGRNTIADLVSAGLGWTPVESLTFSLAYSYGHRRDPGDDTFRLDSHVASAGFNWRITKGLGFNARYAYEENRTEGFPDVAGGRATASLSYGVDWR